MAQSSSVSDGRWAETLSDVFLIRPARRPWLPLAVWISVAAVSLTLAIVVALRPGQMQDLDVVRLWMRHWLTTGANPYPAFHIAPRAPGFETTLDYPPLAFLLLWPIGAVPEHTLLLWYFPLAIGLTLLAGWHLTAWMSALAGVTLRRWDRAALMALMLAGNASRLAIWHGQTMPLALCLSALALRWAAPRPWLSALMLALCSYKPHIALGVGLAILCARRGGVTILARAVVIALALTWAFARSVGASLGTVLSDYAANIALLYSGVDRVRGMLSVRFVIEDLLGSYSAGLIVSVTLAAVSLVVLAVLARRRADPAGRAMAAAAAILWSLLFLPNQRYHVLFAAPALWLLMWPESGLIREARWRRIAVAAYVLYGVFDLPLALRIVSEWHPALDPLFWHSFALSPLRPAVLFLALLITLSRTPAAPRAAASGTI